MRACMVAVLPWLTEFAQGTTTLNSFKASLKPVEENQVEIVNHGISILTGSGKTSDLLGVLRKQKEWAPLFESSGGNDKEIFDSIVGQIKSAENPDGHLGEILEFLRTGKGAAWAVNEAASLYGRQFWQSAHALIFLSKMADRLPANFRSSSKMGLSTFLTDGFISDSESVGPPSSGLLDLIADVLSMRPGLEADSDRIMEYGKEPGMMQVANALLSSIRGDCKRSVRTSSKPEACEAGVEELLNRNLLRTAVVVSYISQNPKEFPIYFSKKPPTSFFGVDPAEYTETVERSLATLQPKTLEVVFGSLMQFMKTPLCKSLGEGHVIEAFLYFYSQPVDHSTPDGLTPDLSASFSQSFRSDSPTVRTYVSSLTVVSPGLLSPNFDNSDPATRLSLLARGFAYAKHFDSNFRMAIIHTPEFADAVSDVLKSSGHPDHDLSIALTEIFRNQIHQPLTECESIGTIPSKELRTRYNGCSKLYDAITLNPLTVLAALTHKECVKLTTLLPDRGLVCQSVLEKYSVKWLGKMLDELKQGLSPEKSIESAAEVLT
jgi:hypothetical protein